MFISPISKMSVSANPVNLHLEPLYYYQAKHIKQLYRIFLPLKSFVCSNPVQFLQMLSFKRPKINPPDTLFPKSKPSPKHLVTQLTHLYPTHPPHRPTNPPPTHQPPTPPPLFY